MGSVYRMAIKIDVKKSVQEFDFDGINVTANYSDENIKKMLKLKDGELQKKAEAESKKLAELNEEEISDKEFEHMVNICIDLYSAIYAPVFTDKAFKEVYEHIQSISATIQAFEDALDYVTSQIDKRNTEHMNKRQKKIDKYKNRKLKK